MSSPTTETEYFNDKLYIELKKKFATYIRIKKDDKFTNDFIASEKIGNKYIPFPEETIRYLREYLVGSFVHYSYDKPDVCRYINFWLNRAIRQFNNFKYGSNFDLFKKFAQEFSQDYYKNNSAECKGILNYIDSDTYEKMETIYKLYELYDELTLTNLHEDKRCLSFGNMISIYNNALENYDNEDDKDYKLIEKLYRLKNLTVDSILTPDKICPHRKWLFKQPNKYLKRLEEEAIKKRQQEEELQSRKQEELQKQNEQKAQEELDKQKLQQREELDTNDPLSNGENLLSATITQHRNIGPSLGVESLGGLGYRARHEFERTLPFLTEQQEQTDRGYGELKDQNVDTSTTSGITGAIKDTFTTIVQNVDSAPVLGVSGGMGVLFILFKYTPVGSFFGGRRGRFRQIPSSFRGFPPDFANFQEYGGGYVGYSPMDINPLAE